MKAARSVATHHTLGGGGGGRFHPPSPPHISSFFPSTTTLSHMLIAVFGPYSLTSDSPSNWTGSFQRLFFTCASSFFHVFASSLILLCAYFVFHSPLLRSFFYFFSLKPCDFFLSSFFISLSLYHSFSTSFDFFYHLSASVLSLSGSCEGRSHHCFLCHKCQLAQRA